MRIQGHILWGNFMSKKIQLYFRRYENKDSNEILQGDSVGCWELKDLNGITSELNRENGIKEHSLAKEREIWFILNLQ